MRTVASGAVALSILASIVPAQAHFMWLAADDPINEWLGRQYSVEGSFCCSKADAYFYDGGYTINADGSVTIPLDGGGELTIEAGKRVKPKVDAFGHQTDPNPTGGAVWWHGPDGSTYCWADGPLG
jgi:hypothetical protein